jgi:zinc transport system substrate-binding protein
MSFSNREDAMKRLALPAVGIGLVVALAFMTNGCAQQQEEWPNKPGPKVVVSFAPIYCFATAVAGEDAVVKNLMTTTGPHHFHPTDVEARLLRKADLFFINGLNLDNNAASTLQKGASNPSLKIVDLSGKLDSGTLLEGVCHHTHAPGEAHEHGDDPHVWLGPSRAIKMVEGIRDALKEADPAHAANYDRRAAEYIAKLEKLKADGLELLKDKKQRSLVTFHESMNYFADEFKLDVFDVVQQKPGSEPNPQDLQKLIEKCAAAKVAVVAVEPQYSRNLAAKTVLDELRHRGLADAAFVEFDPLETVPPADLTPDWYERKMRENLKNLADGMK